VGYQPWCAPGIQARRRWRGGAARGARACAPDRPRAPATPRTTSARPRAPLSTRPLCKAVSFSNFIQQFCKSILQGDLVHFVKQLPLPRRCTRSSTRPTRGVSARSSQPSTRSALRARSRHPPHPRPADPASAVRDAACPLSTRGGTRLVRLVRGKGGGGTSRPGPAP
jgi:hypothetical protein